MTDTPLSLLYRLQKTHTSEDWLRFAELYSPLLLFWARRLESQEADAADLTQDVLTRVWGQIGSYRVQQGKRFRSWLWIVTRNRWHERARHRPWPPQATEGGWWSDVPDPADQFGTLIDDEYNSYLINRAIQLMRQEFEPTTWQACWAFVVEGRPAQEVAAELNLTPNAVYSAKARVLKRLREELSGLLE